jgi:hypothetical protein
MPNPPKRIPGAIPIPNPLQRGFAYQQRISIRAISPPFHRHSTATTPTASATHDLTMI